MGNSRRRVAIGIFAAATDIEAVLDRLRTLGIERCERFVLPADQSPSDLALQGPGHRPVMPFDSGEPASGPFMLRVYPNTMAEEQTVARMLLESAALSVQLHDLDPPATSSSASHGLN